jgi:type IV pilus assembly protein PilM
MLGKRKTLVGLDIGSSSVKAIEMTDLGDRFAITGYAQRPVESKDTVVDSVREVISAGGFKTKQVVTGVSGRSVIVRYVTMMRMSDEDLRNAVKYEADKYIPFEVEEVILDCQRLEEAKEPGMGENEMKVLLVAVKKTFIEDHVAMLLEAGLKPAVVDVDCFALGNAFELKLMNSPRFEGIDKVDALIDIGANKTNINIMKKGTSYFTREVYLGGNDFTDAISRRLSMDLQEAELTKMNPGGRDAELEESVQQTLDDLANEIHLSFDYYENQFDEEVDEVFISGGSAALPGLAPSFERAFGKKINFWDPIEDMEIRSGAIDPNDLAANAGRLVIAVGLASRLRG